MTVILNDKIIELPSSISEFTLGRRVAFHHKHGEALAKLAEQIQAMPEGEDREIYLTHYNFEIIFRTVSFFTGVSPEVLKQSDYVDEIAKIFYVALQPLFLEEESIEPPSTFNWKGEEWVLHSPELKFGSAMKFGELIDAKQRIKDIVTAGGSKWEYMIPISAIYLRKKGEEYKEEFLYEDSDRLKLMEQLPMNISVEVGFFLSGTISTSTTTLKFSGSPVSKVAARISRTTLTVTAGSTSLNLSLQRRSSTLPAVE